MQQWYQHYQAQSYSTDPQESQAKDYIKEHTQVSGVCSQLLHYPQGNTDQNHNTGQWSVFSVTALSPRGTLIRIITQVSGVCSQLLHYPPGEH
jgi:hypothetical protein